MIIVRLMGGLGNQMFCYAAARRLAYRHETLLKLDLIDYREGADRRPIGLESFSRTVGIFNLNVTCEVASDEEISALKDPYCTSCTRDRLVRLVRRFYPTFLLPESHVQEGSNGFHPEVLDLPNNCYLFGFWQSEKYFKDIGQIIREEFTFRDLQIPKYAKEFLGNLKAKANLPIVSVHMRRGDLAYAKEQLGKANLVYGPPVTLDYIHRAMLAFGESASFLIFSDSAEDITWCRQNITGKNLHFSEGHSDLQDFAIMSSCDHHIIANSSFSWWAAWLNESSGKRVVAPKQWFASSKRSDPGITDLIPTNWQII